jgi:hypothetical protein
MAKLQGCKKQGLQVKSRPTKDKGQIRLMRNDRCYLDMQNCPKERPGVEVGSSYDMQRSTILRM